MSALGIMVLWTWIRREVLNKRMLWCFILAEVIFWSPCIVGAILGTIVNKWFWTVCTAYIGFWVAPFTPANSLTDRACLRYKENLRNDQKEEK